MTFGWRFRLVLAAVMALGLAAYPGEAKGIAVQWKNDPKLGLYLTAAKGMTLYVFDKDEAGKSNCTGNCAQAWPPFRIGEGNDTLPAGLPGTLGTIDRADGGAPQVTYNGKPLYYFARDKAPGDTTGQGVGEVWYVANMAPTVQVKDTSLGQILVGPNGMTLYTFARDEAGKSNCTGGCLQAWPPLLVADEPAVPHGLVGKLEAIKRDDGSLQVTYNGRPLYYYPNDKAVGDTTGQGVGGVWAVVKPAQASEGGGNGYKEPGY